MIDGGGVVVMGQGMSGGEGEEAGEERETIFIWWSAYRREQSG